MQLRRGWEGTSRGLKCTQRILERFSPPVGNAFRKSGFIFRKVFDGSLSRECAAEHRERKIIRKERKADRSVGARGKSFARPVAAIRQTILMRHNGTMTLHLTRAAFRPSSPPSIRNFDTANVYNAWQFSRHSRQVYRSSIESTPSTRNIREIFEISGARGVARRSPSVDRRAKPDIKLDRIVDSTTA